MARKTRFVTWNGKDLPAEFRDPPAGRYVVEAVEEETPALSLTAAETLTRARNAGSLAGMRHVLDHQKQQQVLGLGRLGWPVRRIAEATGVDRATARSYLLAAGIPVRGRGRPGERAAKPAISGEVSTDSTLAKSAFGGTVSTDAASPAPTRAPSASACEPYRELIVEALGRGRNAVAIWQDLVDDHGFSARYASVRRFVLTLRGTAPVEARVVITTAPGEEGQVDYGGDGPMVRDATTGKYRRVRLFVHRGLRDRRRHDCQSDWRPATEPPEGVWLASGSSPHASGDAVGQR